jgi:hypothetical protein
MNRAVLLAGVVLFAAAAEGRCAASAPLLRQDLTARMFSMGGVFAAIDDDPGAVSCNPGGLGFMRGHRLSLSTWEGLDQSSRYAFASGIVNAGWAGSFNANYASYNSGDEEVNELDGTARTVNLQRDHSIGLGWGHSIGKMLSAGVQGKYISSKLVDAYSANTATLDAGLMARTPGGMVTVGAGVRNAVGSLKYISTADSLPRVFYGGAAVRMGLGPFGKLLAAADVQKTKDEDGVDLRGGVEYGMSYFAVRAGGKRVDGDAAVTVGGGVKFKWIGFDYGFEPAGSMAEPIHKFTLNLAFGASGNGSEETSGKSAWSDMLDSSFFAAAPQAMAPAPEAAQALPPAAAPPQEAASVAAVQEEAAPAAAPSQEAAPVLSGEAH